MEHRYSTRMPLVLNVLIYRQGLPVQAGRTRNLSADGVFVDTHGMNCRRHDILEVEFLPTGSLGCERFRVNALVVRCEESGVAFEFDNLDAKSTQLLQRCLQAVRDYQDIHPDSGQHTPAAVGFI